MTFEKKTPEFYTTFFSNHPDFEIIEPFTISKDREEDENLYVGRIKVLNTIHPLEIRVEIPFNFPHHKLTFRTTSLKGYPHLIHTGKIKYGDWFCLNTPFAETAEEQLNQEISRLKEWISRQMKDSLPPIITDPEFIKALRNANIPEWMNPDEIKEVSKNAELTFVGDFAKDPTNFKERMGYLNCIKTRDYRFYAFKDKYDFNSYKLPYLIVESFPYNCADEVLGNFLSLKKYYKFTEEICRHLLPDYPLAYKSLSSWFSLNRDKDLDEATCMKQLDEIKATLESKVISISKSQSSHRQIDLTSKEGPQIKEHHKSYILSELDNIKDEIKKNHGIKREIHRWSIPQEEWTPEMEEDDWRDYKFTEHDIYLYDRFALGFQEDNKIFWRIFFTNHALERFDQTLYEIGFGTINIDEPKSIPMNRLSVQDIDESVFFGRGGLCEEVRNKKVALVGLGAIGSMVSEILAHSGIKQIGLWDMDIVEPGNICRSAYRLGDIGESKVVSVSNMIRTINPFISIDSIKSHGTWEEIIGIPNNVCYIGGSFYENINYHNQADAISQIQNYDIIIDCTGSNEILHFLSYAVPDIDIISLCITNKAKELVCVSNYNGNPFELRKAYLSRIAQDTKDYYVEGSGCYEPTFKATNFDIASLVNLCIRDINSNISKGHKMPTTIYKYTDRGIVADRINTYALREFDIKLNIPQETLLDAMEMDDSNDLYLGFIFGYYSKDGKEIMVTDIVDSLNAENHLINAFNMSKGIIDYIGDYTYSADSRETYHPSLLDNLRFKAKEEEINSNNPMLAIRNPEGDISFFLYINDSLIPFCKTES